MNAYNKSILCIDDVHIVHDMNEKYLDVNDYDCLYDIAKKISTKKVDLCIINAHFKFTPKNIEHNKYEYSLDCAGIDLLKHLRLIGIKKHCILLTPLNYVQLLRIKPSNLIITSRGVSIKNNYCKIGKDVLEKCINQKAESEIIDAYIKADLSLPEDERHNWANWWGIDRLWCVHKIVENEKYKNESRFSISEYPENIKEKIKTLSSQEALYLYGHSDDKMYKALKELNYYNYLNHSHIDKEYSKIYNGIFNISEKKIKSEGRKKIDNAAEKMKLISSKAKLNTYNSIEEEVICARSKINNINIDYLRSELSKRKIKIIIVDDQARDGWSDIIQYMIYDKKTSDFIEIVPNDYDDICDFYKNNIKSNIDDNDIDLILLDLRLRKSDEDINDIENMGGCIILKSIRADYPFIPIIMMTATNKIYKYNRLTRLGADAFWIKEGVDSRMTERESIQNYIMMLELTFITTSRIYKTMHRIATKIRCICMFESKFWWEVEEGKYVKYVKKGVQRQEIINVLVDSLTILKNYLNVVTMKKYHYGQNNNWLYASLLVLNVAKVSELIYEKDDERFLIPQNHKASKDIKRLRNKAAHMYDSYGYHKDESLNIKNVVSVMERYVELLCVEHIK